MPQTPTEAVLAARIRLRQALHAVRFQPGKFSGSVHYTEGYNVGLDEASDQADKVFDGLVTALAEWEVSNGA